MPVCRLVCVSLRCLCEGLVVCVEVSLSLDLNQNQPRTSNRRGGQIAFQDSGSYFKSIDKTFLLLCASDCLWKAEDRGIRGEASLQATPAIKRLFLSPTTPLQQTTSAEGG